MSICAVIPAAGRGTRLAAEHPKILTRLTRSQTIWSLLYAKLAPLVDHIHLVLSPEGAAVFPALPPHVSVSLQPHATGMGDAIFRGREIWSDHDAVLVVWGDQVFVSQDTFRRCIALLGDPQGHAVLPLTRMPRPYVEYIFTDARLVKVLQTREGDSTAADGLCDVGTFLLGTAGLGAMWEKFLQTPRNHPKGTATGEINFLPFLPYLAEQGWQITPLTIADVTEARGINTKDDLAFFRHLYKGLP